MKNISMAMLFFLLLVALPFVNAQDNNSKATNSNTDQKPKLVIDYKANKLDADGGKVEVTQEKVEKAVSTVGSLFKRKKEQTPQTATAPVTPTNNNITEQPTNALTPANNEKPLPPIAAPATLPAESYNGEWRMHVAIKEKLTNAGQRQDASSSVELGMDIKISGGLLTGKYTWAKGACGIANIEGTMTGANSFEATITYSGGCCGGAKMKFIGTFDGASMLTGKFKPEGLPGNNCETWWATVKGERE